MVEKAFAKLAAAGAEVVEVALPAAFAEVLPRHRIVMAVEAAMYHEPRLKAHPEDYDRNVKALLEEGLTCTAAEYARTKEHQKELTRAILACFEGVDALMVPGATGPAPDAGTTGDPAFNSPWSYTGVPAVSFPSGWSDDGLPMALQVVGRPWSEAELFATAYWCEQMIGFERREVK
jgi:aspartyl-tRNA(Asn)/glutamyl-tRNA(Gln) amidotransferase subunit A